MPDRDIVFGLKLAKLFKENLRARFPNDDNSPVPLMLMTLILSPVSMSEKSKILQYLFTTKENVEMQLNNTKETMSAIYSIFSEQHNFISIQTPDQVTDVSEGKLSSNSSRRSSSTSSSSSSIRSVYEQANSVAYGTSTIPQTELHPSQTFEEELDRFLNQGFEENTDTISFWLDHAHHYPKLVQLALRLFSIPVASADVERLFSFTKETTSGKRSNTSAKLLEAICTIYNEERYKEKYQIK